MLDRETIRELLGGQSPLLEGMLDQETQLQPNGIDLTLKSVSTIVSQGFVGASPAERVLSSTQEIPFGDDGSLSLSPGSYLITLNEVVNLPLGLAALGRPRSSLLRCGVAIHTAVWDAGYSGRSQALLVVYNPHGFRLSRDARVMQLVFVRLSKQVPQGYDGIYQGENV
ncbi:MAG: deoxyuridine 5'-triphosphate nucleotidohydrolase [Dehalococcoidia bacterium]|nr:deoxyuridine 5'-triphosphate nucleotidohydrolase [Dehalococcoidia bacterium]